MWKQMSGRLFVRDVWAVTPLNDYWACGKLANEDEQHNCHEERREQRECNEGADDSLPHGSSPGEGERNATHKVQLLGERYATGHCLQGTYPNKTV